MKRGNYSARPHRDFIVENLGHFFSGCRSLSIVRLLLRSKKTSLCRTSEMSHAHPERGRSFERGCHERKRTGGERWLWRLVGPLGFSLGCETHTSHRAA